MDLKGGRGLWVFQENLGGCGAGARSKVICLQEKHFWVQTIVRGKLGFSTKKKKKRLTKKKDLEKGGIFRNRAQQRRGAWSSKKKRGLT